MLTNILVLEKTVKGRCRALGKVLLSESNRKS